MDENHTKEPHQEEKNHEPENAAGGKVYAWLLILYALGLAVVVVEYLAGHANI